VPIDLEVDGGVGVDTASASRCGRARARRMAAVFGKPDRKKGSPTSGARGGVDGVEIVRRRFGASPSGALLCSASLAVGCAPSPAPATPRSAL